MLAAANVFTSFNFYFVIACLENSVKENHLCEVDGRLSSDSFGHIRQGETLIRWRKTTERYTDE